MKKPISLLPLLASVAVAGLSTSTAEAALSFTDLPQTVPVQNADVPGVSGQWDSTGGPATVTLNTPGVGDVRFADNPGAGVMSTGTAVINLTNALPLPGTGFYAVSIQGTLVRGPFGGPISMLVQWGASSFTIALPGADGLPFGTSLSQPFARTLVFSPPANDFAGTSALTVTMTGTGSSFGIWQADLTDVTLTSNPEPASIGVLGSALVALSGMFFRRRRKLSEVVAS